MSHASGLTSNSGFFQGYAVIACGTLRPELNFLREVGFFDAERIIYTPPGLHESPRELIRHLRERLSQAQGAFGKKIIVFGDRCYLNYEEPLITIDRIIGEFDISATRVQAANCVDMMADVEQRKKIAGGRKIYWMTMGWVLFWKRIFRNWDAGKANETFPAHEKAIVLDPINAFAAYSQKNPEKVLEFSDWMRIPIEAHQVSLERFKNLLIKAKNVISRGG